jgi:hypothetical protein
MILRVTRADTNQFEFIQQDEIESVGLDVAAPFIAANNLPPADITVVRMRSGVLHHIQESVDCTVWAWVNAENALTLPFTVAGVVIVPTNEALIPEQLIYGV